MTPKCIISFSYNHYAMDELALIRSAVDGDLDAFNRLVLEYQESAFNVALRILVKRRLPRMPPRTRSFLLTAT